MAAPSTVLAQLLVTCPTVWQVYMQACGGLEDLNLTSFVPWSSLGSGSGGSHWRPSHGPEVEKYVGSSEESSKAIESCRHGHFACLFPDAAGKHCRTLCPLGVVFSMYQILLDAFAHRALEDARTLLTNLIYLRVLLPEACNGLTGDGCSPLLPAGWFEEASSTLQEWIDDVAYQELLPASPLERRLVSAHSLAVVSAFYSPPSATSPSASSSTTSSSSSSSSSVSFSSLTSSSTSTSTSASSSSSSSAPAGRPLWGHGLEEIPFPWYYHNKRCYSERHGYAFVFETSPPSVNLHPELDGYKHELHWVKLTAVRQALKSYDWVFWIDHDALFANVSLPLQTFLDQAESESSPDLIVQDSYQLTNPNAFFIRNTPWSWRFLDTWERFGQQAGKRGKMWELRTFNCALVHMLLIWRTGSGIRRCSEFPDHLSLLRRLLEIHSLNHQSRQSQRIFGKIYFWDPIHQSPRGFLFNSNDAEQQRYFPGEDLYHMEDLAVHWPKPDKGTQSMRLFANEQEHLEGCERWLSPKADLEDVYQPSGSALAPALYSPEVVLGLVRRWVNTHKAAVLAQGPEGLETMEQIKALGHPTGWRSIDILQDQDLEQPLSLDQSPDNPPTRQPTRPASISKLPLAARYDLIYLSLRPDATLDELNHEVSAATRRLTLGGLLVVPIEACGHADQANSVLSRENFEGGGWRITTTPGTLNLGGTGLGCHWAYLSRAITSADYHDAVTPGGTNIG